MARKEQILIVSYNLLYGYAALISLYSANGMGRDIHPKQAFGPTVELLVVLDAMTLMWRHGNTGNGSEW